MPVTITWNPNGGSVSPTSSSGLVPDNPLPNVKPTHNTHSFIGWFTAATGGTKVSFVPHNDTTYYAHWEITEEFRKLTATIAGECTLSFDYQNEWKAVANVVKNRIAAAPKEGFVTTIIGNLSKTGAFGGYGSGNYNTMMSWYTSNMPSSHANATYYNKLINAIVPVYRGTVLDNSKNAVFFNKGSSPPYTYTEKCDLTFDKEHNFFKLK